MKLDVGDEFVLIDDKETGGFRDDSGAAGGSGRVSRICWWCVGCSCGIEGLVSGVLED